jgi:Ohr subfamily peroxiredoxin
LARAPRGRNLIASFAAQGRRAAVGSSDREPGVSHNSIQHTARVHTTGGRDGDARSDDGRLVVRLSRPGADPPGADPEQLLAAGWSACFIDAVREAACAMRLRLPAAPVVDAEVDLRKSGRECYLQVRLRVGLPGLERDVAEALVDAARRRCPYAKATRGNIDVVIAVA